MGNPLNMHPIMVPGNELAPAEGQAPAQAAPASPAAATANVSIAPLNGNLNNMFTNLFAPLNGPADGGAAGVAPALNGGPDPFAFPASGHNPPHAVDVYFNYANLPMPL